MIINKDITISSWDIKELNTAKEIYLKNGYHYMAQSLTSKGTEIKFIKNYEANLDEIEKELKDTKHVSWTKINEFIENQRTMRHHLGSEKYSNISELKELGDIFDKIDILKKEKFGMNKNFQHLYLFDIEISRLNEMLKENVKHILFK